MRHAPVITTMPRKGYGSAASDRVFDWTEIWQKTKPRFIAPTLYRRRQLFMTNHLAGTGTLGLSQVYGISLNLVNGALHVGGSGDSGNTFNIYNRMYNVAYGRLVSRLQEGASRDPELKNSSLGTTLAEYGKTREYVADALESVAAATKSIFDGSPDAVVRRRLADVEKHRRKVWRKKASKRRRKALTPAQRKLLVSQRWLVPRWLGSRWLEYWMVVAPTIGDIDQSLRVLTRDLHFGRIRGTAKDRGMSRIYRNTAATNYTEITQIESILTVACNVRAVNPNLILANSLGLLNPATVGVELIPWSWFVGWFVNWQQVLNSWTDFVGYSVSWPAVTTFQRYNADLFRTYTISPDRPIHMTTEGMAINRKTGTLPMPTLRLELPGRLSGTRAATAISLVVNLFTSTK